MRMKCACHSDHSPAPLDDLTGKLRDGDHRITGPRQAVLEVLRRHAHPMTNREIRGQMQRHGCDLATIYRSMHLLEKLGLVQRFDFGDGVARFELLGANKSGHHHHLVCVDCSGVVELEECFPSELQERIARANGYKAVTHRLEFFGICPACQQKDAR